MSNVSLERYYFVLYDGALTLKMSKMALNAFCDKTLHIYIYIYQNYTCALSVLFTCVVIFSVLLHDSMHFCVQQ